MQARHSSAPVRRSHLPATTDRVSAFLIVGPHDSTPLLDEPTHREIGLQFVDHPGSGSPQIRA